jgi:uncharacterized protein (TIGR03083 family)
MPARTTALSPKDAAALLEQLDVLADWLSELPGDDFAGPTVLPSWDVHRLTGHLVLAAGGFADILDQALTDRRPVGQPLPAAVLVTRYRRDVEQIEQLTEARTAGRSHDQLLAELRSATDRLRILLGSPLLPANIKTPRGPGRLAEFVRTRIVDVVVHSDDLSRSLPDREPVPIGRQPMAICTRTLAGLLAEQHPGKSVEVRVPPYAAVQCGIGPEGPSHTRGTPPNVVETDPVTFLRLATGRLDWATARADAKVSASGQRADLTEILPVLT